MISICIWGANKFNSLPASLNEDWGGEVRRDHPEIQQLSENGNIQSESVLRHNNERKYANRCLLKVH